MSRTISFTRWCLTKLTGRRVDLSRIARRFDTGFSQSTLDGLGLGQGYSVMTCLI